MTRHSLLAIPYHLPHPHPCSAANAGVKGEIGDFVQVTDHRVIFFVLDEEMDIAGEADLFIFAELHHMTFDLVTGDDDAAVGKFAHFIFTDALVTR